MLLTILGQKVASPAQERDGLTGVSPVKSHKDVSTELRHLSYKETEGQRLCSQGRIRLMSDLMNIYENLMGGFKGDGARFFSVMLCNMARGSRQKLKHITFHLKVRTYWLFFILLGGLLNIGIGCPESLSPSLKINLRLNRTCSECPALANPARLSQSAYGCL